MENVFNPREYKLIALRECPLPAQMHTCDTPERAVEYWKSHLVNHPAFSPDVECFFVVMVNTRRKIKGHYLVSMGTNDTILVHPREVFRVAILAGAHAIIMMHNHPSGDSCPSEADVKATRDLLRSGQLLKIELLDHIVVGNGEYKSLREMGYLEN